VRFVPGLGFNYRQLGVAVNQHVVGNLGLGAHAAALQPPLGDTKLAPHHTAFHYAPACGRQRGVNVLGVGFGFVHGGIT